MTRSSAPAARNNPIGSRTKQQSSIATAFSSATADRNPMS